MMSRMQISSTSPAGAVVQFSRSEVLALRNLLAYAPHVPLEVRGPGAIFDGLLVDFKTLADDMSQDA